MAVIDYDKGVLKRKHPLGLDVYMYVGQPGVFLNAHGGEVSPQLAAEAGFDTDALLKERRRRDRVAEAESAINAEFNKPEARKVVARLNGYEIVRVNGNNHVIVDAEGNPLTTGKLLTKEQAVKVAEQMSPVKPEPEAEAGDDKQE